MRSSENRKQDGGTEPSRDTGPFVVKALMTWRHWGSVLSLFLVVVALALYATSFISYAPEPGDTVVRPRYSAPRLLPHRYRPIVR